MIVQRVLRKAPQPIHVKIVAMEKVGQELGVPAAIRKIREPELAPGIHVPVAVAVVDHLDRRAVEVRKILMEGG